MTDRRRKRSWWAFAALGLFGLANVAGAQELVIREPDKLAPEDKAIVETIRGLLDVYNNPKTAMASPEERIKVASRFYVPDEAYAADDQPIYFGPLSDPVVIGARRNLANINMNYDQHSENDAQYRVGVSDYQIRRDGHLAAVIANTFSIISAGKQEVRVAGRWTVLLEKIGDRWLISHEHISFY